MRRKIAAGCVLGIIVGLVVGAIAGIIFGALAAIVVTGGIAIPAAAGWKYRLAWWIGGPIALLVLIAANAMAIRGHYL
jgi:hypothetical protein